MTMIAVFKSRAQALDFVSFLRSAGVPVQPVANPPEAGVGCGISARFDERFFSRVRFLLGKKQYSAFAGFMKQCGSRYCRV